MRDIVVGGSGIVLGGVLGSGFVLGAELLVLGTVGLTLLLVSPSEAPVEPVAQARMQAAPAKAKAKADAGQVHLITYAAVQLLVDGRMAPMTTEGYLLDVAPGSHRIEVVDLLGRRKVDTSIEVVSGQRHSYRWRSKTFEDMGTHGLMNAPIVAAPPGHANVEIRGIPEEELQAALEIEAANDAIEAEFERMEGDFQTTTVKVGGMDIPVVLPKLGFGKRKGRGRR